MSGSCKPLQAFFDFLEKTPAATISEVEQEGRLLFPDAKIENRRGAFLIVEFKTSLPCLKRVVASLGIATDVNVKSPPPLDPKQAPLTYASIEENPFHWVGLEFTCFDRTIGIESDYERIKLIRIDPPKHQGG